MKCDKKKVEALIHWGNMLKDEHNKLIAKYNEMYPQGNKNNLTALF